MGLIDLEDESSSTQFGIRSLFSDLDHRKIAKRMQAARIAKVQGGSPVRRLNGYGWRLGVKDEAEAAWLTYMYQQSLNVGGRVLAADLKSKGVRTRAGLEWTDARLRLRLKNPMYKGEYQYGRGHHGHGQIKAVCQVEALVSPELWAAAQDATQRRRHAPGRRGSQTDVYPLQGRLTCAECGRSIGGNSTMKGEKRWYYYGCGDRFSLERTCTHRTLYPAALIHAAVREVLQAAHDHPTSLARSDPTPHPRRPRPGRHARGHRPQAQPPGSRLRRRGLHRPRVRRAPRHPQTRKGSPQRA